MNPRCAEHPLAYKDAIFLSPHKFIGGPGTPGVLVVRRELLTNPVPDVVGGGTVAYVNPSEHVYLADPVHREEGGTPAIVESIRAGLVFQLKQAVGVDVIRAHEERLPRSRAMAAWDEHPHDPAPGQPDAERLSIVSFTVRRPGGRYLHHNFVVALLNDLFGIQSRGGCSCAGPYGHRLLGIDIERSHEFEREITRGCEGIKPGWVRVNFNYFISEAVFRLPRRRGRAGRRPRLAAAARLPLRPAPGLWRHRAGPVEPPLRLADVGYDADGVLRYPRHGDTAPGVGAGRLPGRGQGRPSGQAGATRRDGTRRRLGPPDAGRDRADRRRGVRGPALVRPAAALTARDQDSSTMSLKTQPVTVP